MKKFFLNTNPFILLLAPVFLIATAGTLQHTISLELPNVSTELVGMFNNRTIFQVLCEVIVSKIR
ncbi:hypothetical protein [Mucilaginibacter sp.]|uniref:hypothetical protein n=1 Tax=Mucilaginibacter sp. TaxID=1882438 RepID=UPI003AFF7860